MDKPYSNFAYAELNLSFNKELFVQEYDDQIFPSSQPFVDIYKNWELTEQYNSIWNIVPLDFYQTYAKDITNRGPINGQTSQWDMVNLMRTESNTTGIHEGGASWRNINRYNKTVVKDEFKNLEIVKWIYNNLSAERIIGMHCVSIEPGGFSTIHRDMYWDKLTPNPAINNGFFQDGFVVVNINISSGGVPLRWCLDGNDIDTPRDTADLDCYIISDYFRHAVPMTTDRRRQIRVSLLPTKKLLNLINWTTAITLPNNYKFDTI